jgi:REP element-mobilizing transposase RayT
MPRPPRVFVENGYYHVTLRGNHHEALFRDEWDRARLDTIVAESLDVCAARLHSYCWMTNHLHLLVQISTRPLGQLMQRIAGRYSRAAQKKISTSGHLFENRYHARLVDGDTYFQQALRYIHLNPVQAGLVSDASEHAWSSHGDYTGARTSPWVTTDVGLSLFDAHPIRARVLYERFVFEGQRQIAAGQKSEPAAPLSPAQRRTEPRREPPAPSLLALAEDVCAENGIALRDVVSGSTQRFVCRARDVLARRAIANGVATPRELAAFLKRSEAAVSRSVARGGTPDDRDDRLF